MFFPNVLASVTFTLSLVLSKFDINLSLLPLANYDIIKYQVHPHTSPKVVCAYYLTHLWISTRTLTIERALSLLSFSFFFLFFYLYFCCFFSPLSLSSVCSYLFLFLPSIFPRTWTSIHFCSTAGSCCGWPHQEFVQRRTQPSHMTFPEGV